MPEVIVLDTHVWLWFINGDFRKFPESWRDRIETADHVGISPVSCYEIALAAQRGRLDLPSEPEEWFRESLAPTGVEIFPLSPEIAAKAVSLTPVHRDPFDRIIIATALENQAWLASIDGLFTRYPELSESLMR